MNTKRMSDGPDWTFDLLTEYQTEIARVADFYRLDIYPNQIEVITAEQMMDAYSSVGMPIGYNHWSYGKKFIQTEQNYKRGQIIQMLNPRLHCLGDDGGGEGLLALVLFCLVWVSWVTLMLKTV